MLQIEGRGLYLGDLDPGYTDSVTGMRIIICLRRRLIHFGLVIYCPRLYLY